LPDTLLESELFGYKKGAFTGADRDFSGKVSMANGGTLFLDEIGELSLNVQSKLLKLLEEGVYSPLGSTSEYEAHIRIISATNQSITDMIKEKKFREDLFYRINSVILEIPPLRERKEDIFSLAYFFLKRFSSENRKEIDAISEEGLALISRHNWPGNIRELRNVIHRAVVLSSNDELTIEDFPDFKKNEYSTYDITGSMFMESERELVLGVLNKNNWNISASARELGLSRGSLRHRIKKYSLRIGYN
jgi:two-component system NtrC family response regulator